MSISTTVKTYHFDIELAGMEILDSTPDDQAWHERMDSLLDALSDRVLSADLENVGLCGVGSRGDVFCLGFIREGESLAKALGPVVEAIESAGLAVSRVDVEIEERSSPERGP